MKTTFNGLFLSMLCISAAFSACGAGGLNDKAVATATQFYKNLQQKNFVAAVSLCSNKAFAKDTKEAWVNSLEKNAILLGQVKSFTKTSGFNIAASTTTGTTVTIAYDVQWQYGQSKDSITLIKEADGSMKIYNYRWDHSGTQYIEQTAASAKQAGVYMDAVKAGNYDAALNFCSAKAFNTTSRQDWKAFFSNADQKLGTLSGYHVMRDSCFYNIEAKGESGLGNYYDIYVKSRRGSAEVTEKLIFFQKNYAEPVKLVGHQFL